MKFKNAGLVIAALVALTIASQQTASAQPATATESVNLTFTGVTSRVNSVYALVVDQGATTISSFYLDDAVSLGTIPTGNSSTTFSFDTPTTETPVGVILAGVYGSSIEQTGVVNTNIQQISGLTLGLNSVLASSSFVGQSFDAIDSHYGGAQPEIVVVNGIQFAAPGFFFGSPLFTNLIDIPPLSSSTPWVALDGSQAGTLVDFSNGASNGAFNASPVPAPLPALAALIGFAALAAWKLPQRRALRA